MAHQSALIAEDIHAYLKSQEEKSLLRFITCGSVDDGKSTLIGRLLWDSKMVFEDQLATLQSDSKKVGTQNGNIDYALLLDGLQAEREQGITIDVAYRFFSTDKRKFIVADTPGHEQYTRNMVTGASNAQVAVILIDARKGVLTQTKRHSYLVSLVGIRKVVLAINKMDLVDYSAERFEQIRHDYQAFVAGLGFSSITAIPLSALNGDNMIEPSPNTPWYRGPTLLEQLETIEVVENAGLKPFRMRVQWVNRPNLDFRGFCGTIASGVVRPGDEVVVSASQQKSRVKRIVTLDGDLPAAGVGQAVTLTLEDEIDLSRGDTLASPKEPPYHADHMEAKLVWLHESPLKPGQSYLLKAGSSTAPVRITELKFKINVNRLEQEKGTELVLNEVGVCSLQLDRPLSFDSYRENSATGSFILIDRLSNATVGAGMIHQPLRRPAGNHWQQLELTREVRGEQLHQTPQALWFVGQTPDVVREVARQTEKKLHSLGRHTYLVDAAANRHNPAELIAALVDAGLIALVSLPLGSSSERLAIQGDTPGKTVYCDFSGSESVFEAPQHPELTINRPSSADEIAEQVAREFFN